MGDHGFGNDERLTEMDLNRIGPEWYELSGRAKDLGSAAVFLSLLFGAITWAVILGAKL